jgi:hypothetical protein
VHTEITALWGGRKVELRETQRVVTRNPSRNLYENAFNFGIQV